MNKYAYRTIFNAARQAHVAVPETATSAGKATGASSAIVATALASLLAAPCASAQIRPDPAAPGIHRPQVLVAPNGVPLVNITTPSAAGVSRNIYQRFDVGAQGVILNNSRTNVQTQLGGVAPANPWLAGGPARVIVNEVNSSAPSYLRGHVEVAGQRAEVIIANPSGIQVDGGGFINASKATLTTGAPQFNMLGGLDSFVVRGGTITIDGAGLDLSKTDYAAILARATAVNAAIWANRLKVVTGANQISADHEQVTPIAATGNKPVFALDVAALGGMYAGHIFLVGTEAGLGVRSSGAIEAGAGGLVLRADGWLEHIGTIQSMGDASLSASSLANGGSIASGATLKVATQGDLANVGGTLEGRRVELSSAAGDIDNRAGTIRQTSAAGLTLAAKALSNTNGGMIGPQPAGAAPAVANASASTTSAGAGGAASGSAAAAAGSAGAVGAALAAPPVPGAITAAGTIRNDDGGRIHTAGAIALQAPSTSNAGGELSVTSMAIAGPSFSNAGGSLNVSGAFSADVGSFENTRGKLQAGSLSIATTGDLVNQDGTLTSDTDAALSVGGNLLNARGAISSAGALTAQVAGAANNTAGGSIGAATDLSIRAGSLTNAGAMRGGTDATLAIVGAVVNDGSITTGRHTAIAAGSLQGGSAGMLGAGIRADGSLGIAGDLNLTTAQALVANGTNLAAGSASLQGASVDLSGSQSSAANIAVAATQGNATTSRATVVTPGTLTVTASSQPGQTLVNDAGSLMAGQLALDVSQLANTNGGRIVQSGTGATSINVAGALLNDGGTIASHGNTTMAAGSLSNRGGTLRTAGAAHLDLGITGLLDNSAGAIDAGGNASIRAGSLANDTGRIAAVGDLAVTVGGAISNLGGTLAANGNTMLASAARIVNAGTIAAGHAVTLTAADIDNQAAGEITGRRVVLSASGTLSNRGLIDGESTHLAAGTLTNSGSGRLYGDRLSIQAGTLNNQAETVNGVTTGATIAARERLDIAAGTLSNRDGALILSAGDLAIGGALDAGGHATGQASLVHNHAATIEALGRLTLGADTLRNSNGGVTYTMVEGAAQRVLEFALNGTPTRFAADEALLVAWRPDVGAGGQDPLIWPSFSAVPASSFGSGDTAHNMAYLYLLVPQLTGYPLARYRDYYLNAPRHSADRGGMRCTGGDVSNCTYYASPGHWYAASDPIWAAFGVAPPPVLPDYLRGVEQADVSVGSPGAILRTYDPNAQRPYVAFDQPLTQAQYDALPAFMAAHRALDTATQAFMAAVVGPPDVQWPAEPVVRTNGAISFDYSYWDYSQTQRTPQLTASAPARILSGGAMNLAVGSGTNEMSQIVAGGNLSISGGTIVNQGLTADAKLRQVGQTGRTVTYGGGGKGYLNTPYDHTIATTVTLAAARLEGNAAFSGSGAAPGAAGGTRVAPILEVVSSVKAPTGASGAVPILVRTAAPNTSVPSASLFRVHGAPDARYLVETDPRFASQRGGLSSDYLLDALGLDPARTLKRLGDGFYEQQLIREQMLQLTGRRFLDGYSSDTDQYAALLNEGVTFAQQYQLTPGVALTAAQMAQLTSDIVWLVEQEVALPDGSTRRVLVPQLYVRVRAGDIDGSGALLAGRNVDIRLSGDLTNASGTVAGRQAVVLNADNIANLGGRITGHSVDAQAKTDLKNIGGVIDAEQAVRLGAGRDLQVESTTRTSTSVAQGSVRSDTVLDRVAGVYVGRNGSGGAGGMLEMSSGRDAILVAATIDNQSQGGTTRVQAERDLRLDTVTTARSEHAAYAPGQMRLEDSAQQAGSTIGSVGHIELSAKRDFGASAAHIASRQGSVAIGAGRDAASAPGIASASGAAAPGAPTTAPPSGSVTLEAGRHLTLAASQDAASSDSKLEHGHGNFQSWEGSRTSVNGTQLSGASVTLKAQGDITSVASSVTADKLAISTPGQLNLLTATAQERRNQDSRDHDAWFIDGGAKGSKHQTTVYNQFNARNVSIDAGAVNAQVSERASLSELASQPGMGWISQLQNDPSLAGRTQWQRVREVHEQWDHTYSGLGPASQAIISLIVAYVAWPAAAAAGGAAGEAVALGVGEGVSMAGGGTFLSATGATVSAATSSAVQAGITSMASQAAVSFVNNNGNVAATLDDLGSSASIRNIATAVVTGGVIGGLGDMITLNVDGVQTPLNSISLQGGAGGMQLLGRNLINNAAGATVSSAINGGSFEDNLTGAIAGAFISTGAALGANQIGQWTSPTVDPVTVLGYRAG